MYFHVFRTDKKNSAFDHITSVRQKVFNSFLFKFVKNLPFSVVPLACSIKSKLLPFIYCNLFFSVPSGISIPVVVYQQQEYWFK